MEPTNRNMLKGHGNWASDITETENINHYITRSLLEHCQYEKKRRNKCIDALNTIKQKLNSFDDSVSFYCVIHDQIVCYCKNSNDTETLNLLQKINESKLWKVILLCEEINDKTYNIRHVVVRKVALIRGVSRPELKEAEEEWEKQVVTLPNIITGADFTVRTLDTLYTPNHWFQFENMICTINNY